MVEHSSVLSLDRWLLLESLQPDERYPIGGAKRIVSSQKERATRRQGSCCWCQSGYDARSEGYQDKRQKAVRRGVVLGGQASYFVEGAVGGSRSHQASERDERRTRCIDAGFERHVRSTDDVLRDSSGWIGLQAICVGRFGPRACGFLGVVALQVPPEGLERVDGGSHGGVCDVGSEASNQETHSGVSHVLLIVVNYLLLRETTFVLESR